jgi:hypothetical protein
VDATRRRPLSDIRAINGIKSARGWLGLSITDVANILSVPRGSVVDWQSGRREMPLETTRKLGQLIVDQLAKRLGRDDIGLEIVNNGRVKITISARCAKCSSWFELHHSLMRLCEKCRVKR